MSGFGHLFSRRRMDRDLVDEIQAHLEEKTEALEAEGVSHDRAALQARRQFGNVTGIEERGRDVWHWRAFEDFFADLRFGLRQVRKAPVFAFAAIATLALGIGANTAVFSVVNAVVLRPLPFPHSERLMSVETRRATTPGAERDDLSYPDFFDFRARNHAFEHLVCYRDQSAGLSGAGEAVNVAGEIVSWDLFDALGVHPAIGRGFRPEEERSGSRVLVISDQLWRERLGSDPSIVGRQVLLNRIAFTVIGVAPRGFAFPVNKRDIQFWTTLALDADSDTATPMTQQRGARMLDVIGRLKPGVSIEHARSEMDAIAAGISRQHPEESAKTQAAWIEPELDAVAGNTRRPMIILLGAVALVLLMACANIANLLLARTSERQREFALRASIGAGRCRLVRQLLAEGLALAVAGAAAGIGAAAFCVRAAVRLAGDSVPRIEQASIDGRVLGFSIALAFAATILFSLGPAVRLARSQLIGPLRSASAGAVTGRDRLRSTLAVVQIALGLVLLSGAALLGSSFVHLMRRDPGFPVRGLLSFSVSLPQPLAADAKHLQFENRVMEGVRRLPGVTSVATAYPPPLIGSQITVSFDIEERPAPAGRRPTSDMAFVSVDYFKTAGIPLLEGRLFTENDDAQSPPVLVVNRAFANKFFPGERVLGKRIQPGATATGARSGMREIVGVVGNARQDPMETAPDPVYYYAAKQLPWCCASYLVRTTGSPLALEPAIRRLVASTDPADAVYHVRPFEDTLSEGLAGPRFVALLLSGFALIALALTVVGLYGVLSYSVAMRTREIGVRVAMGAGRGMVLRMILREAGMLAGIGVGIGLACAIEGNGLIERLMTGAANPQSAPIAGACCIILIAAALAAWFPARRAASVDPMIALRME